MKNFKSFKSLEFEFSNFNIISANFFRKTNLIQIFKFLRNISKDGLKNAIYLHGGAVFFQNINKLQLAQIILEEVYFDSMETYFKAQITFS